MGPGHRQLIKDGYVYDVLRRWYVHSSWTGPEDWLPPKPWGFTEKESFLAERSVEDASTRKR